MRIDDENKVVIPYFLASYIEKAKEEGCNLNTTFTALSRALRSTEVDEWLFGNEDSENDKRFLIAVKAWVEGYEIEQPQKYYWRKKKEYITILDTRIHLGAGADVKGALSKNISQKFTEQEARDILKYDFDKFEKVECE